MATTASPVRLDRDLDIALLRWSLILIFAFFGYAKWFAYEAKGLEPFFINSPLLSWMPNMLGLQGASYALGVAEWVIGVCLILGIWVPWIAVVGALGSVATFVITITLIFTTPGAWEMSAGGFPAMGAATQFLIKDVVLLAASLVVLMSSLRRLRAQPMAA